MTDDVFIVTRAPRVPLRAAAPLLALDAPQWPPAPPGAVRWRSSLWAEERISAGIDWLTGLITLLDNIITWPKSERPAPTAGPSSVVRLTACDIRVGDWIKLADGSWALVERVVTHLPGVPLQSDVVVHQLNRRQSTFIVHRYCRLDDVYAVPADWPPEMLAATG